MNRKRYWLIYAALVVFVAMALEMAHADDPAHVNGVRVDGAALGEWTHDWDAAVAAAKKDGKPIFINFTGSDWCGWCKLLKREVFSKSEWIAWASKNVYLVHIDFPQDKKLVPEKYKNRNERLRRRYGVGGYPTCYLLSSETLAPLGRFGASRNITASSFIEQVSAARSGVNNKETPKTSQTQRQTERLEEPQNTAKITPEFEIKNGVLVGMKSRDVEHVIVPEGVKTVCIDGLVYGHMKTLTITDGVEAISRRSGGYYPGTLLEKVKIPASVKRIDATAFDGNWKWLQTIEIADGSPYKIQNKCLVDTRKNSLVFALTGSDKIVVPDSVKMLGDWSFKANDAQEVVIPEGVEIIGRGAFKDCRSLEILTIPASVEVIGKDVFDFCGALSKIQVSPNNPRYAVRDGYLIDCKTKTLLRAFGPLKNITIPDGIETIGDNSFSYLKSLISVTVPDTVRRIEHGAFSYCKNLEELHLPEKLDFYEGHFIMGCSTIKSIQLPPGLVTVYGNYSFGGCASLRELVLPDGLRTIGSGGLGAVCRCVKLERIFIPASVSSIMAGAFNENPNLQTFDVHQDNLHFCSKDGVLFSKDMTRLIRCPETKNGVYEIPHTVQKIDDSAFLQCRHLNKILIPESMKDIGGRAFAGCPSLKMLEFENRSFKLNDNVFGKDNGGRPATNLDSK